MEWNIKDLGIQKEPNSKSKGPRVSAFLITINTNYKPNGPADAQNMSKKVQDFMNYLTQKDVLPEIVTFIDANQTDKFSSDTIVGVDGEYRVELGSSAKGGRVHAHFLLTIQHNSKIRIDRDRLQGTFMYFFKGDDRIKNPHIDIKIANTSDNIKAYLRK